MVPLASFEALVGHRLLGESDAGNQLDGAELYLACGCVIGDAAALRMFDQQIASGVPAALRRMKLDDAAISDVLQQLRVRMFVSSGAQPARILDYAGTGKLVALVHVAAKRLALDVIRSQRRIDPSSADDHVATVAAISDDAATMLNKAELRQALRQAFEQAATQLQRRDRTLLRMSVLVA
jgi:RNA polymerase sigma-70 factor, ECF subfamily